jgi:multiple sugar transport system substrate-binding protein
MLRKRHFFLGMVLILMVVFGMAFLCEAKSKQPFAGKTIRIMVNNGPHAVYLPNLTEKFERKTGIHVKIDMIPESSYSAKMQLLLSTKSDDYDVMYMHPIGIKRAIAAGWVRRLDDYLADKKLTDKKFDYQDFYKAGREQCSNNKLVPYGIPNFSSTFLLFYNKDMFREAGLKRPPQNITELTEYAAKLTDLKKNRYGIAMRATREGAIGSASWIILYMLNNGYWFDRNMKPLLNTPEAIKTTEEWVNLLGKYAPPGVGNYGFEDVSLAFEQERVAMVIEDTCMGPSRYEDPGKSKVAGKVGYCFLKPPRNMKRFKDGRFILGHGWSFSIPIKAKNPKAAWQWIQYATSYESYLYAVKNGYNSGFPRKSVWASEEIKKYVNNEWLKAAANALSCAEPEWMPLIPEGSQIREEVSIAITDALSGKEKAETAMKKENKNVARIMKNAGYYK